ncbi:MULTISPECIES: LamG domain-containing protein [unclassified Flavobacterium]|uniref:LamG domain-containing protein n=1 Tax=unclassified Flavobacterium TaxID=196869 RepID=UPI001F13007B|nr:MULTISPECIES: LamG domain-containing protein [unclassified Flavobacterium]UMY65611.1 LamG domain-containing protein [Flavobacterium sp. HJ-32-4]
MRSFLLYTVVVLSMLGISCQTESLDSETVNPQNLTHNAPLTKMLQRLTTADEVSDNAVDSSACFRIQRPYQVAVHDQEGNQMNETVYTVQDDESQTQVNTVIEGLQRHEGDWMQPVLPVTIIHEDGTQQVLATEAQWNAAVADCAGSSANTDPINCININYPITIFAYDANYQLANTYTLNDDADLFALLMSMQPGQYFAVDYPISLTFSDGNVVTVADNAALLAALDQAVGLCNPPPGPCDVPNILTDNLIIYVPFANEARDLVSGDNLAFNANYPPQFVTDRSGNTQSAVSFSGAALDYLALDETVVNHLKQGDSLTVSVWFRMQNTDTSNLEKFFEKAENDNNVAFFLGVYDMNRPLFFSSAGGVQSLWDLTWNNETLWNDTTNWHHLALTIEGDTDTVRIYRDGTLVATDANSNFNITSEFFRYFIGKGFHGHLDDLRVYRSALSASQVSQLAQQQGDNHTCLN